MILKTKKIILWLPTAALLVILVVVFSLILSDNNQRIKNLEDQTNSSVITFVFNQGQQRYRIICNLNKDSSNIYVCTTIRITPTPTPTPTR